MEGGAESGVMRVTGTGVDEARRRCPGIALVSQRPDLYVRVQRRIANAVNAEIPIDAVCSADELCCDPGAPGFPLSRE